MLVPEGHEVVLHQGQDLGVELGVSGQHLQGFIDKSETRKVELSCKYVLLCFMQSELVARCRMSGSSFGF